MAYVQQLITTALEHREMRSSVINRLQALHKNNYKTSSTASRSHLIGVRPLVIRDTSERVASVTRESSAHLFNFISNLRSSKLITVHMHEVWMDQILKRINEETTMEAVNNSRQSTPESERKYRQERLVSQNSNWMKKRTEQLQAQRRMINRPKLILPECPYSPPSVVWKNGWYGMCLCRMRRQLLVKVDMTLYVNGN